MLQSSLTVPIFYLSDEGLYRFHVTDWNGKQELAIEIAISVIGNSLCLLIVLSEIIGTEIVVIYEYQILNECVHVCY